MSSLLLELRVEEIPAGYVRPALEDMKRLFAERMRASRLDAENIIVTGTPRRLALYADGIPERQEDIEITALGPPAKAAFDADGKPTKAALGFARAQGAAPEDIELRETDKGPRCCAVRKTYCSPTRLA